ncbi:E3 ubiquitin-protein ligase MARCHF6 [Stomoxys calcitrans]|uniref:E3 ubiquitin-protein ligase MARCHF6 n=1 Tax=Stomoxys calcitrans TaxID=35570 RepID=A0A1I8P8Q2_STOCA|nr:E3 ubiquitin-protein ligase MARCHF6 [Stomoxys calcitrans]
MDDLSQGDICRVCRCEAQSDRPLFYPCVCTGSIKYIHQDCLMQWMRYSHKEYCELCGHRFSFQPIYSPDMPRVLPLRDVAGGLLSAIMKAAKSWAHYSLVGLAWFVVVPLSAYRTYRFLFRASSFDMILSLPFDVFSTENLASDVFRGCFVVTCTLLSFIGLVWLREQILLGGGPDWLERDDAPGIGANNADDDEVELNLPPDGGGADAGAEGDVARNGNEENANAVEAERAAPEVGVVAPAAEANDNGGDQPLPHNNNIEAPIVEPMNNNAPAVADPAENEGDPPLEFGPQLPPALAGNQNNNNAANPADNDNDEPNWNPMEWDRAAEELTWERLLGLDGSLVFLEHVFWIVSLNTMLIFAFAFCPYCIGHFILNSLDLMHPDKPLLHFHGLITTLFGYCFIGIILVVLHFLARAFHMRRVRSLIGLCYIVVKVSLLSVVEIGGLPLVCGWWLDICSLPLFDATLKDRKASFSAAPGTSLFVHWMFGMVFVYYFAAFISLLREVLRPGVLWFLRNLNDPDFSPIQEMIHLPIFKHVRRLISSAMIFGSVVLLMLWIPIRVLKTIWPTFLPYTLSGDSDVNELSLQLLLLQIVLPGFFEQSHTRVWLKKLLRIWCICVSWVLGIRSYLLGEDPETTNNDNANKVDQEQQVNEDDIAAQEVPQANNEEQGNNAADQNEAVDEPAPVPPPIQAQPPPPPPPPPPPQQERNLAAVHHAFIHRDIPVAFQPYDKPTVFQIRLFGLIICMCISLVIASLVTLTVPVWIGRQVMSLWSVGSITTQVAVQNAEATPRPHELYTAALGTYLCWMLTRGIAIAVTLLPQGRAAVMDKIKQWLKVGASYALPVLIIVLMLGVIPLLFGMLLELVVVIPVRVGILQTPIYFIWQDWALGVLYTKIAIALTLMGPDWHLKRALERAYRDGLRDIDLKFLITELAMPVITCFGLALAIPYVLAHSILPIFFADPWVQLEIAYFVYPVFFSVIGAIALIYFQIRQFKKLYVAIKVDKYLVGQRLVNYEHRKRQQEAAEEKAARQKAEEEQENVPIANIVEQAELERRRRQEAERQQLVQDLVRGDLL